MYENLPLYECHKQVRAARITHIRRVEHGAVLNILCNADDITRELVVLVSTEFIARCPALAMGGYFVCYSDGYTSYSPATAFEEGYKLVKK
jgi:hypothetical protein